MNARVVAVAIAAAIAIAPAAARAQDSRKEAEKFFRAGEQAYNAGDYLLAAEAFEEAYAQLPLPAIAFSTAQAHRLQYVVDKDARRIKRAIGLYRKYIAEVKQGGRRDDAVSHLADLEPVLARIEARSGTPIGAIGASGSATKIMISSNVKGARASIDGGKPAELPVVKTIGAGNYKIAVTAKGYFPVQQEYAVVDGQFRAVEINLTPRPALITVRAPPDAEIVIDGRPAGSTPLLRPVEVDAGKHLVTVIQRGRTAWSHDITVERGEELTLTAELSRTRQRKLSYGILGAAGGAFAIATLGSISALGANSDANDIEDRRTAGGISPAEFEQMQDAIDERDQSLRVTYVMLGIGAGLAATGALLYYMDMPRPEAYRPAVVPTVSDDGAGLSVVGRF